MTSAERMQFSDFNHEVVWRLTEWFHWNCWTAVLSVAPALASSRTYPENSSKLLLQWCSHSTLITIQEIPLIILPDCAPAFNISCCFSFQNIREHVWRWQPGSNDSLCMNEYAWTTFSTPQSVGMLAAGWVWKLCHNCMMHEMLSNEILEKRIIEASWRTKTKSFVTLPINIVASISNLRFRLIKTPHGDDGFSLLPDDVLTMKFHARAIIIQVAAMLRVPLSGGTTCNPFCLDVWSSTSSFLRPRCTRCDVFPSTDAFLVEVCRATHFSCWKI